MRLYCRLCKLPVECFLVESHFHIGCSVCGNRMEINEFRLAVRENPLHYSLDEEKRFQGILVGEPESDGEDGEEVVSFPFELRAETGITRTRQPGESRHCRQPEQSPWPTFNHP